MGERGADHLATGSEGRARDTSYHPSHWGKWKSNTLSMGNLISKSQWHLRSTISLPRVYGKTVKNFLFSQKEETTGQSMHVMQKLRDLHCFTCIRSPLRGAVACRPELCLHASVRVVARRI